MPLNITSSSDPPLICFDVSPITHLTASMIFDFPHPLGPTTPVLSFEILIIVVSTNDLKPDIFIWLSFKVRTYL